MFPQSLYLSFYLFYFSFCLIKQKKDINVCGRFSTMHNCIKKIIALVMNFLTYTIIK